MKLLLIEDDLMLSTGLCNALEREGFAVNSVSKGQQGINLVASFKPDIIILDLGLPDMDGMDVLHELRKSKNLSPILILTARDAVTDKVKALDRGADDYLAKPFEIDELLARIRVLARRLGTSTSSVITVGTVKLDNTAHQVSVTEQNLNLTSIEFKLLKALLENVGRIQTKDMLVAKLYGWGDNIGSNTIEVHISNLRKKLPNNFIKTIRGVGYTISDKNTK